MKILVYIYTSEYKYENTAPHIYIYFTTPKDQALHLIYTIQHEKTNITKVNKAKS